MLIVRGSCEPFRYDVGSISSVWPCQGSENDNILVEIRRIFFRYKTYVHEKNHARVHILSKYMPLISDSKHSLILVQIDQTFVRGDRKQPIP